MNKIGRKIIISSVILIILNACSSTQTRSEPTQEPPTVSMPKMTVINTFDVPEKLEEISGLMIDDNTFWGFNDSGGKPEIYQLSNENNLNILKTVQLKGVKNVDWESIADSDTQIFIGNFGNNRGNRKDLEIYYFDKKEIKPNEKDQKIKPKKIQFYFPDQTDFSDQNRAHNFDCESMLYLNGKLHLFTKEWKDFKTHHYILDIKKGKQKAQLIESFDAGFLVTGADAFTYENKTYLAWVGYTRLGDVYVLQTKIDLSSNLFFEGKVDEILMGTTVKLGQTEGIAIESPKKLCLSAEKFKFGNAEKVQNITCYKLN